MTICLGEAVRPTCHRTCLMGGQMQSCNALVKASSTDSSSRPPPPPSTPQSMYCFTHYIPPQAQNRTEMHTCFPGGHMPSCTALITASSSVSSRSSTLLVLGMSGMILGMTPYL